MVMKKGSTKKTKKFMSQEKKMKKEKIDTIKALLAYIKRYNKLPKDGTRYKKLNIYSGWVELSANLRKEVQTYKDDVFKKIKELIKDNDIIKQGIKKDKMLAKKLDKTLEKGIEKLEKKWKKEYHEYMSKEKGRKGKDKKRHRKIKEEKKKENKFMILFKSYDLKKLTKSNIMKIWYLSYLKTIYSEKYLENMFDAIKNVIRKNERDTILSVFYAYNISLSGLFGVPVKVYLDYMSVADIKKLYQIMLTLYEKYPEYYNSNVDDTSEKIYTDIMKRRVSVRKTGKKSKGKKLSRKLQQRYRELNKIEFIKNIQPFINTEIKNMYIKEILSKLKRHKSNYPYYYDYYTEIYSEILNRQENARYPDDKELEKLAKYIINDWNSYKPSSKFDLTESDVIKLMKNDIKKWNNLDKKLHKKNVRKILKN